MLRRFGISLAFATWCFLNTWVEFAEGESSYFARYDPFHAVVIPVVCLEILIAGAMLAAWEFGRNRRLAKSRAAQYLFLTSCLVPVGIAAVATLRASPFNLAPMVHRHWFWPVLLAASVLPLGFALLHPYRASRLMRNLFMYSWPVLAIVLAQAAHGTLLKYPFTSYENHPLAMALPSAPSHIRVVWIIFDELSQSIAFDRRPEGLGLPNLDRLRSESFYASAAEAPGSSTEISMPSLILGEQVIAAHPHGPDGLYLRMQSRAAPITWSAAPNVFDTARGLGFNTALVGWFHPYGRLLSGSLTRCYWTAGWLNSGVEERSQPQALWPAMWDRVRLQVAVLPGVGRLPGVFPGIYHRQEKIERFSYLLDRTLEVVTDPSIGLVLVHLPVPHPPAIYDRSVGKITAQGRIGYLDSVALADQTLGTLRRSMEQASLWDQTAVLVSADHGWRTSLWRGTAEWTTAEEAASHTDTSAVPFLLKLPGQHSGIEYHRAFDTVATRRLITEILAHKLTDPAGVPASIEHHDD